MKLILFIVSFTITVLTCVLASEFSSIVLFIIGLIFALITTIILEYTLDKYHKYYKYYKFDEKYFDKKFTCYLGERKDRK